MTEHEATIAWARENAAFTDGRYTRAHRWRLDGGIEVMASASPRIVPAPFSIEEAIDPEEAFVASLASCHMLWFLALAAGGGLVVDRYVDRAIGVMGENGRGRLAMIEVTLRPEVAFARETRPTAAEHGELHARAHERCFIANSVTTIVRCEASDVSDAVAPPAGR